MAISSLLRRTIMPDRFSKAIIKTEQKGWDLLRSQQPLSHMIQLSNHVPYSTKLTHFGLLPRPTKVRRLPLVFWLTWYHKNTLTWWQHQSKSTYWTFPIFFSRKNFFQFSRKVKNMRMTFNFSQEQFDVLLKFRNSQTFSLASVKHVSDAFCVFTVCLRSWGSVKGNKETAMSYKIQNEVGRGGTKQTASTRKKAKSAKPIK